MYKNINLNKVFLIIIVFMIFFGIGVQRVEAADYTYTFYPKDKSTGKGWKLKTILNLFEDVCDSTGDVSNLAPSCYFNVKEKISTKWYEKTISYDKAYFNTDLSQSTFYHNKDDVELKKKKKWTSFVVAFNNEDQFNGLFYIRGFKTSKIEKYCDKYNSSPMNTMCSDYKSVDKNDGKKYVDKTVGDASNDLPQATVPNNYAGGKHYVFNKYNKKTGKGWKYKTLKTLFKNNCNAAMGGNHAAKIDYATQSLCIFRLRKKKNDGYFYGKIYYNPLYFKNSSDSNYLHSSSEPSKWYKFDLYFENDGNNGHLGGWYEQNTEVKKYCKRKKKSKPMDTLCADAESVSADAIKKARSDELESDVTGKGANVETYNGDINSNLLKDGDSVDTCKDIIGNELADKIKEIFNIVKIMVPILLIVYGIVDFGKAIFVSDENEMKKAQSKFIKRLIIACAFFVIPSILKLLLNIASQVWDIKDVTFCGILGD